MVAVVSVQVRMASSRLPGKVMLHLGPERVVGHAMQNCERASAPAGVILAIGDGLAHPALVEWAERAGYDYVVGSEENVLARHAHVAAETGADYVVRVCGDSPFVSAAEIDRLVDEHVGGDADMTTNASLAPPGTVVEVADVATLEALVDLGERHPSARLLDEPERWDVRRSGAAPWEDLSDVDMAVDTPADYWRLVDAVDAAGRDPLSVATWLRGERQV